MLESDAASERRGVEKRAEQSSRREESRAVDEKRAEQKRKRDGGPAKTRAEPRDETEREQRQRQKQRQKQRQNPAEFRAMNVNKRELELAGRARDYIESVQRRVRVVAMSTSTQPRGGAHLAALTPLIGAVTRAVA
jgi:hypothetical protein